MAAILHRAEDLGAVTANQARYLWAQLAKAGYKTNEPIELEVGGEEVGLLDELIETYRKDLGYTNTDLQEIIPLNEEELWSQYFQKRDHPHLRII